MIVCNDLLNRSDNLKQYNCLEKRLTSSLNNLIRVDEPKTNQPIKQLTDPVFKDLTCRGTIALRYTET